MPVKFLSRWTSRTFGQFFRLTFSPFTYFQSSINCFEKKNLDMAIILNMFSMCSVYVWVQRERVHGSHSGVSKADLVLAAVPLSVVASWSFSQAPNPFRMLQPPPHNVDNMLSHSSNYLWLIGAEWNFQLCLIQFTFPPFVGFCQLLWGCMKKSVWNFHIRPGGRILAGVRVHVCWKGHPLVRQTTYIGGPGHCGNQSNKHEGVVGGMSLLLCGNWPLRKQIWERYPKKKTFFFGSFPYPWR